MNKYKVINKAGVGVNVAADFYNTCTSTGISTFYVEHDDIKEHSPELVATFGDPVSISKSKEQTGGPCFVVSNLLSEHNNKIKAELKNGVAGYRGSHDEFRIDYVTYSFVIDISKDGVCIDKAIGDLYKELTMLIFSVVNLKSAEKKEGCEVLKRDVVIHYRRYPEYEIEGNKLYLTTRLTAHHKDAE